MQKLRWLWCLGLFSISSQAAFIIPYELRLWEPGETRHTSFSVLVILADHYANFFNRPDALSNFLIKNHHPNHDAIIDRYRRYLKFWYEQQASTPGRARRLGMTPEEAKLFYATMGMARNDLSSDIVITRHHDFSQVLAMVRGTVEDEEGFLPEERYFFERGEIPLFPGEREPHPGVTRVPKVAAFGFENRSIALDFPIQSELAEGHIGGLVSGKSLAIDPATGMRLLQQLSHIAYLHKIFSLTAKVVNGEGVYSSGVWVGCTGGFMREFHKAIRFEEWWHLNSESTRHTDAFLMNTTPDALPAGLQNFFTTMAAPISPHPERGRWLIYDETTARKMKKTNCLDKILEAVSPEEPQSWMSVERNVTRIRH